MTEETEPQQEQAQAPTTESSQEGSRLIMFTGKECDHCHDNLPEVEKVEKELNVEIVKLEVWHDATNAAFLEKMDKNPDGSSFCGAIPLYLNEKTGKKLCGPQQYEALLSWAKGEA